MGKRIKQPAVKYNLAADTRPNKDGDVRIYLRLFESGRKVDYFTGVRWPPGKFDRINQCLLPRHDNDPDCLAYNLILGEVKKVAHQVHLDAFTNNKEIDLGTYLHALGSENLSLDFVQFAFREINRQYNANVILYKTWRQSRSSVNKFVEFWGHPVIPIAHITYEKIQDFDAFCRRTKAFNTVSGYHKVIKKFIGIAVRKGLITESPYDDFKFRYIDGDREALTQDEVRRLRALYQSGTLAGTEQEVLRRFLFSCLTGIRISDTHRVTSSMIKEGVLKFKPKKGLRYGKIVTIPLPRAAMQLVAHRDGPLFDPISDKHINYCLKVLAMVAGIDKRMTYHCARDTFGTIFIELGGDIKSCADLMGHSSTRTTAIYLKMSDKRKHTLMNNFDQMFGDDDLTDDTPVKRLNLKI